MFFGTSFFSGGGRGKRRRSYISEQKLMDFHTCTSFKSLIQSESTLKSTLPPVNTPHSEHALGDTCNYRSLSIFQNMANESNTNS
jgi:hypothetical protein